MNWTLKDDGFPWRIIDANGMVVCRIGGTGDSPEDWHECRDNAHKLVAAPELLEALKGLTKFLEQYPHKWAVDIADYEQAAMLAIAKAEGRGNE